jgi:hypothetical protein
MSVLRALALASLLAATAAAVTVAPPALAAFGPLRLVSKGPFEQAAEASEPALSADGHYLTFKGSISGLVGIFREDVETQATTPVVAASAYGEGPPLKASAPSVSADGRYVSFTTTAQLDPANDPQPQSSDVYVADMSTIPPTYQLASALDAAAADCPPGAGRADLGAPLGLEYTGPGSDAGSFASGRVALSADGRRVVFVTGAESNLTSGSGGSTPGTPTPALQVAVRDLDRGCTTLVSVEREASTGEMTDRPVTGGAEIAIAAAPQLRGASLSADGTVVAWLGGHLPAQVPLLADEAPAILELDEVGAFPYAEPLWRRIADGPSAPTRRIVGGGDPLAPGCPPGGTLADPSCQGPFPETTRKNTNLNFTMGWLGPERIDGVPQLSADGGTVALIGNPSEATNVFLVDMAPGLSRKQAVRQLTRQVTVLPSDEGSVVNQPKYIPLNGHVFDLGISPDGQRIAFATARQQFPLAPPNLITGPPAQLGLVELYEVNLDGETLRRATHGYGGPDEASLAPATTARSGAGASSPSFGAGGHLLAFSSTASNLVEGDGNDASDVFLVEDGEASRAAGPTSISPAPPGRQVNRRQRLRLSATSLPNGDVRLVAVVPGPGRLGARAGAPLRVDGPRRRLTAVAARAAVSGPVALTLSLPGHYRRLSHTREGLYAMARVSFRPGTGKRLQGSLQVRFHAHVRKHRKGGK